jgi:hypothetical protein
LASITESLNHSTESMQYPASVPTLAMNKSFQSDTSAESPH